MHSKIFLFKKEIVLLYHMCNFVNKTANLGFLLSPEVAFDKHGISSKCPSRMVVVKMLNIPKAIQGD